MKKLEVWEVLGKQYKSEKEAKKAEQDYLSANAQHNVGDDVWIWDNLNDRILNSHITTVRLGWYDDIEYLIKEFDNVVSEKQIFNSLAELINHLKENIKFVE